MGGGGHNYMTCFLSIDMVMIIKTFHTSPPPPNVLPRSQLFTRAMMKVIGELRPPPPTSGLSYTTDNNSEGHKHSPEKCNL